MQFETLTDLNFKFIFINLFNVPNFFWLVSFAIRCVLTSRDNLESNCCFILFEQGKDFQNMWYSAKKCSFGRNLTFYSSKKICLKVRSAAGIVPMILNLTNIVSPLWSYDPTGLAICLQPKIRPKACCIVSLEIFPEFIDRNWHCNCSVIRITC